MRIKSSNDFSGKKYKSEYMLDIGVWRPRRSEIISSDFYIIFFPVKNEFANFIPELLKPFIMKTRIDRLFVTLVFIFLFIIGYSQPYIADFSGSGLGEYGYLEFNAVTYATLNRDGYDNVNYLGARWWVSDGLGGQEYIYNTTTIDWQCSGGSTSQGTTNDFNPINFNDEWKAGSNAYVSVNAYYCSGDPGTMFNERHFQVIDIDNSEHSSISDFISDGDGDCLTSNVVGSFAINPGSLTGISLQRIYLFNSGSAEEGTHIPNDGFKVFYESVSGSEVFDGTESFFLIYGNWGGNSTSNNVYGAEGLSVSLSGETRFYVVLCDLVDGASNVSVNLEIINDGLSFLPGLDDHNKMRIDVTGISNDDITLPLMPIDFQISPDDKTVEIHGTVDLPPNSFESLSVEKSRNASHWQELAFYRLETGDLTSFSVIDYSPFPPTTLYRLRMTDKNGLEYFSTVKQVEIRPDELSAFPNPFQNELELNIGEGAIKEVKIYNSIGQLVDTRTNTAWNEKAVLNIADLQSGQYFIQCQLVDGSTQMLRVVKE